MAAAVTCESGSISSFYAAIAAMAAAVTCVGKEEGIGGWGSRAVASERE
jgi:hypothetical protein